MTARILDGRKLSREVQVEISKEVAAFKAAWNVAPTLALVRAGDDPASVSYAGMIERTCRKTGIEFQANALAATATEDELVRVIRRLNDDRNVHGIIIQQPLPDGVRPEIVIEALDPAKDIDGAHPLNAGRLARAAFVDQPQ